MNGKIILSILLLLLALTGCGVLKISSSSNEISSLLQSLDSCPDINNFTDMLENGYGFTETNEYVFFVANSGMYKMDKETKKVVRLAVKIDNLLDGLKFMNDHLYYTDGKKIYSIDMNGTNKEIFFDWSNESEYIKSFYIYQNDLYLELESYIWVKYDRKYKSATQFQSDVNSFVFLGNSFFFEKRSHYFSIYEKDLKTGENKLRRGTGESTYGKPESEPRCENLTLLKNQIYYARRDISGIYKYKENGKDEIILDYSKYGYNSVSLFFASQNNLYFLLTEESFYKFLCQYKPDSKTLKKYTLPMDFAYVNAIINDNVITYIDSENVQHYWEFS